MKYSRQDQFDVIAKVPPGASKDQFREMMRNLLLDRFQLVAHFEKQEARAVVLRKAARGHKLRESAELPYSGDPKWDDEGFLRTPGCNGCLEHTRDGRTRTPFYQWTMLRFSEWLTATLGIPVVDETELTGKYNFSLKWAPAVPLQAVPVEGSEFVGSTLATAVREQLGLTLTNKRMPIQVLVVDHVLSQPSVN